MSIYIEDLRDGNTGGDCGELGEACTTSANAERAATSSDTIANR